MKQVTIYHNPRCSKSRQTLALLEAHGIAPEIILYLETPPKPAILKKLLQFLGMNAREILRKGEDEYKLLGLADTGISETKLITIICANPKLMERPIVVSNQKAVLGRPPENVLNII